MKYSVSILIDASVGFEIEADSPEEAASLAYASELASPSLCHQCSDDLDLGDPVRAVVYDASGKQVLDDGWEAERIVELEKILAEAQQEIERLTQVPAGALKTGVTAPTTTKTGE